MPILESIYTVLNSFYGYYILLILVALAYQIYLFKSKSENTTLNYILLFVFAISFSFLSLLNNWYTDAVSHMTVGGLVPFADVAYYYNSIVSLRELGYMLPIGTERPYGTLLYSSIVSLGGGNLVYSFILMNLLHGIAIFLAGSQMLKYKNFFIAFLTVGVLVLIDINNHGKFVLESPSFLFSTLAFAFFIPAILEKNKLLALSGVFMLVISQNMRLGAIMVLFGAAIFLTYFFSDKTFPKFNLKNAALFFGVVFLTLASNKLFINIYGTSDSLASNLSYVVYGIANKGETWQYARQQNPELYDDSISEKDRTAEIYRLTFKSIREQPSHLVIGLYNTYSRVFTEYADLLIRSYRYFFSKYLHINVANVFVLYHLWMLIYAIMLYVAIKRRDWLLLFAFFMILSAVSCTPLAGKDNGLYRLFRSSEIFLMFPFILFVDLLLSTVKEKIFNEAYE